MLEPAFLFGRLTGEGMPADSIRWQQNLIRFGTVGAYVAGTNRKHVWGSKIKSNLITIYRKSFYNVAFF